MNSNTEKNNYYKLEPWDLLQKKMIWDQLSFVCNKRVLDFGSGKGITANHFASNNDVIAIEPSDKMLNNRIEDNKYFQIKGSIKELKELENNSFDIVICHNVFEYVEERVEIIKEFARILKDGGTLSIVKHNRKGRVMQMAVLLNNFEHANELLDGKNGNAKEYGTINYYDIEDLGNWSNIFSVSNIFGIRNFWHLQQNQDVQKDIQWQEKMLSIESRVSEIEDFKALASFHHIILKKN